MCRSNEKRREKKIPRLDSAQESVGRGCQSCGEEPPVKNGGGMLDL